MIKATQIRNNMIIIYNGQPHLVTYFKHTVTGRGGASIPTKMRNILTGGTAEYTFRSDDKIDDVELDEKPMEFLYSDGDEYHFMDTASYEQIAIQRHDLEEIAGYLSPNIQCKVSFYEGKPIRVTPPNIVQLKVAETEPGIKGATASGNVTKPAKLETGLTIQVPMFIAAGDVCVINTLTGEYLGRPGR